MRQACVMLRHNVETRTEAVRAGLGRLGYRIVTSIDRPGPKDCVVTWNRMRGVEGVIRRYESAGCTVIVMENAYLGNSFAGDQWYAMALDQHNGAGRFTYGGEDRWDALRVELKPYREAGEGYVLLPQRGMGAEGVAMPRGWTEKACEDLSSMGVSYRVRRHPGVHEAKVIPLEDDLRNAAGVVTWGSGAALKAIAMGIPCWHSFPQWIGAAASQPLGSFGVLPPLRDEQKRLDMFRRMIWAQWRLDEIADGRAFDWLLRGQVRK